MVSREVQLRRLIELLLGVADEQRPALAAGDSSMLCDWRHVAVVVVALLFLTPVTECVCIDAPGHGFERVPGGRWRYVSKTLPEEPAAPERTRIQLCGRLSVQIDGVELVRALRGRQVPLLLAYLVLGRERHIGREELSLALWPESAPRAQDAALRTLLSRLRSALGASALLGREQLMLALPEPAWVDFEAAAAGVEQARQAVEDDDAKRAWALAQVPLNICARGLLPGYEAVWLEIRRRELDDLRLEALELVGRAGLALGGAQLSSAQRAARALIEAEPYRESGYVLLMQALGAGGNVAEGLRVFERLRSLLRDELGTAPAPETIAAHERLLRPTPRAANSAGSTPLRIELPPELAITPRVELVGRDRELAQFESLWRAIQGQEPWPSGRPMPRGRVALLGGEPGIGKTRLLAELARRLHSQGAVILAGRSTQETLAPFQPFLEALRHYVLHAPLDHLRAAAELHGGELQRLLPELRRRLPGLPATEPAAPEIERYRLFEAVAGLLAEIAASAPLLLVVDDLHWADRPTLLLLRHLARVPEPARVPILAAYRVGETSRSEPFAGALSDLRHEQVAAEFRIGGLSAQETAELVRNFTGTLPSAALARAIQQQTEGNPLFVLLIVRQLGQAGVAIGEAGPAELRALGLPEDLKRVIAERWAQLGGVTAELLRTAAVVGRDFDAEVVERVSSLDEEQFMSALEGALEGQVIVPQAANPGRRATTVGYGYRFSHPLTREALYEDMSAPRRARLHRRVGEALEALDERAEGGEPDQVTWQRRSMLALHFARGAEREDAGKAIRYARLAGGRASGMLAYEEASEHYARALELLERFEPQDDGTRLELLLSLAESQIQAGDRPLAGGPLRQAADLAVRLSDPDSLGRAAVAASRRYIQQPGVVDEDLISLLDRALKMTDGQETALRVRLLARMCGALYFSPQRERMASLSNEATEIASRLGDPAAGAIAAAARRRAFWTPAKLDRRLADSTEMLRLAREAGDLELTLQAHAWLVVDLLELGDLEAVDAQAAAFGHLAEQVHQPLYDWQQAVWQAMKMLLSGQIEESERLAEHALTIGARPERVTAGQYFAIQMLEVRREQNRMAELEAPLRDMLNRYPNRVAYRGALGQLLIQAGRLDEARAEMEALDPADIPEDLDWLVGMTLLADAYADLGDAERAAEVYEMLLPYEATNVVIGFAAACDGPAARLLGRLAAVIGRPYEQHFERALAMTERLQAPLLRARVERDIERAR
jgi:DNA-binding SARP family transcriptional activator